MVHLLFLRFLRPLAAKFPPILLATPKLLSEGGRPPCEKFGFRSCISRRSRSWYFLLPSSTLIHRVHLHPSAANFGVRCSMLDVRRSSVLRNSFPSNTLHSKCVIANFFRTLDSFCPTSPATLKPKTQNYELAPRARPERGCVLGAPAAAGWNVQRR